MRETILTGALNSTITYILVGVLCFATVIWLLDRFIGSRLRLSRRQAFYGWIFLVIPALYFLAVMIYPMMQAFQFSMQDYNILRQEKPFVGLDNYLSLVNDEVFWKALVNSFRFALFRVPLVIALSLVTALMFQAIRRFKDPLRVFMLLPFMTSMVALGWIFNFLYSRQGPIFNLLKMFGIPDTSALLMLNVNTALPAIALVSAWASIGYYTLLFTVGLDAIPEEIYDAGKVDGANSWHAFWRITLPLLNPTLVLVSILAVTASLKNFDLVRVMSGNNGTGGPVNSTLTMPLFIYMEAFNRLNMGRAAAITVIFFLIILVITLVQLRVTQREVEY